MLLAYIVITRHRRLRRLTWSSSRSPRLALGCRQSVHATLWRLNNTSCNLNADARVGAMSRGTTVRGEAVKIVAIGGTGLIGSKVVES
jgi:hypothetical protein